MVSAVRLAGIHLPPTIEHLGSGRIVEWCVSHSANSRPGRNQSIHSIVTFNQLTETDNPLVPLHLLLFAFETAITTLTCIVEILAWQDFPREDLVNILWLYGPYFALGEMRCIKLL